ncbi:MAG: hypothetical protein AAB505_03025 [Patescibacteria group bacterium]
MISQTGSWKVTPQPFNMSILGVRVGRCQIVPEEHDSNNNGLTEIDFSSQVELVGGPFLTGEEKLLYLRRSGRVLYGAAIFMFLWRDYENNFGVSVLENLYRIKKVTYLDFFGDVLLRPGGRRCVLQLFRGDAKLMWTHQIRRLDNRWNSNLVSAVSPVCPRLIGQAIS